MSYLSWDTKTIINFSAANITALYNLGYLFTRLGKGIMHQTRSLRIDLAKFELTSENRRILRKTDGLMISDYRLPISDYQWSIGKIAKDFYDAKFGTGVFSANKIKELLTDESKSNFNKMLKYIVILSHSEKSEKRSSFSSTDPSVAPQDDGGETMGYAICYENDDMLHYSYPFYDLRFTNHELPNLGMAMMLKVILYTKEKGLRYCYLGSAQRSTDVYKLQFTGFEWFDGKEWWTDLGKLKQVLNLKSQNLS